MMYRSSQFLFFLTAGLFFVVILSSPKDPKRPTHPPSNQRKAKKGPRPPPPSPPQRASTTPKPTAPRSPHRADHSPTAKQKVESRVSGQQRPPLPPAPVPSPQPPPTPHGTPEGLRFVAVGDWGGVYPVVREVSATMAKRCRESPCDFVVSTGDNMYPSGVRSVNDPKFRRYFEDQFLIHPSLRVPWYTCIGNHDREGNSGAQVEYTNHSKYWYLPKGYYTVLPVPKGQPGISESGLVEVFVLDSYDLGTWKEQVAWLDDSLRAPRKGVWRVILNHNPVYSAGPTHGAQHGSGESRRHTQRVQRSLLPILQRGGEVDLYLSGDDHNLQVTDLDGILHVISGAAGGANGGFGRVQRMRGTVFAHERGGFFEFDVTKSTLTARAIDSRGKVLYTHTLKKNTNAQKKL